MILKFVINFRYARSPPAGYRDASPQPHKIERRAPPPPRGPRTPPMSPSRRSKTMTPPPGEDGTPPPPPGKSTIQKCMYDLTSFFHLIIKILYSNKKKMGLIGQKIVYINRSIHQIQITI